MIGDLSSRTAVARPTPSPMLALLRGSFAGVALAAGFGMAIGLWLRPAQPGVVLAACGLAAGAALAAFALAPLLGQISGKWSPIMVMTAAVTAHVVLVVGWGAAFLAVRETAWFWWPLAGWTLLGCTVAGAAGLVRSALKVRILAFGDDVGVPGPRR